MSYMPCAISYTVNITVGYGTFFCLARKRRPTTPHTDDALLICLAHPRLSHFFFETWVHLIIIGILTCTRSTSPSIVRQPIVSANQKRHPALHYCQWKREAAA